MQESINKLISEIFNNSTQNSRGSGNLHVDGEELTQSAQNQAEDDYCAEAPEQLYAYIEAELEELNAALMFPDIHRGLASNRALQNSYAELRELLVMAREDRLVEPPFIPTFDFSYLQQQPTPEVLVKNSWSFDHIGRLVIEFTSELLQVIRPLDLQPAMVKSMHDSNSDKMYHYKLEQQVEDLNVEIGVKPDRTNPSNCHVAAWIAIPSLEGWPNWKNSLVVMKIGDEKLQSQATDAFGRVLFDPIEMALLPQLTFEVTPVTLLH